jgi:hypothetical protein
MGPAPPAVGNARCRIAAPPTRIVADAVGPTAMSVLRSATVGVVAMQSLLPRSSRVTAAPLHLRATVSLLACVSLGAACTNGIHLAGDEPDTGTAGAADLDAGDVLCPRGFDRRAPCTTEPDCLVGAEICVPCTVGYLLLNEVCTCRHDTPGAPGAWVCRPPFADCLTCEPGVFCDSSCVRTCGTCAEAP